MSKDVDKGGTIGRSVSAEAWQEWHERCTIGKCCKDTRRELAEFGRSRLFKPLQRFDLGVAADYCGSEANKERAWLVMEQFLYSERNDADKSGISGKRYKDRFIEDTARSEGARKEGYLTLVFQQTIARRIAFEEGYGIRRKDGLPSIVNSILSLDAPIGEEDNKGTLLDILTRDRNGTGRLSYAASNSGIDDEANIDESVVFDSPGMIEQSYEQEVGKNFRSGESSGGYSYDDNDSDDPADDNPYELYRESNKVQGEIYDDSCLIELGSDEAEFEADVRHKAGELWEGWSERKRVIYVLLVNNMSTAEIIERRLIDDCGKSQIYAAFSDIKRELGQIDWGRELGERQRYYLTRPLMGSLTAIAMEWLEKSEKHKAIYSYIVDERQTTED